MRSISPRGWKALTRTYGVDILVGPTAADLIRDDFHLRTVARVQVKGKTRAGRGLDHHRARKAMKCRAIC